MFICKNQSRSYFYCHIENSSTSPIAEHPPPDIMETQKEPNPAGGILPSLCPGGDSTGELSHSHRGGTGCPGLGSHPAPFLLLHLPLQGSSSYLSTWGIFTLRNVPSFQWFDEVWWEERASKHLCGCISCIGNKLLVHGSSREEFSTSESLPGIWTPDPPVFLWTITRQLTS